MGGNGEGTTVWRDDSMEVHRRDEERSDDKEKQREKQ